MGLSHGRPTIASNLPPFKEKEKELALVTFKDVNDLIRKIKRLLVDKSIRIGLAEGARRYSESVKWYPNIAQKHLLAYKDVLDRRA
jgi:hypothetical protein